MLSALIVAVVFGLLTYWLHRRLVRATRLPRPWSIVVDAILVVMWALALIGWLTGRVLDPTWWRWAAFPGLAWLATVFYLVIGMGIVALASLALRRWRHRLTALRAATAVVAVVAVALTGYGLVEAARPQVSDVTVALPSLPQEFSGLRIALLTDLHLGPARGAGYAERLVDLTEAQHPDLILLGGDLSDGTVELAGDTLAPLARLSAPLGVYAVSGNHEFYSDDGGTWMDHWESLGITTLRNERVTLQRDGATIELVGIHDYTAPEPYEPDLPAALDGTERSDFVLLLAHEPRAAGEADGLGVDLQFSGHTHGGQLWPFHYLVRLQQPTLAGLDRIGDTEIFTSRGAGAWGPPVRVGAPPEIVVLTLDTMS